MTRAYAVNKNEFREEVQRAANHIIKKQVHSLMVEWSLHFGEQRCVPAGESLNRMAVSSEYSFLPKKPMQNNDAKKSKIAQKREERNKNLTSRYEYLDELLSESEDEQI